VHTDEDALALAYGKTPAGDTFVVHVPHHAAGRDLDEVAHLAAVMSYRSRRQRHCRPRVIAAYTPEGPIGQLVRANDPWGICRTVTKPTACRNRALEVTIMPADVSCRVVDDDEAAGGAAVA